MNVCAKRIIEEIQSASWLDKFSSTNYFFIIIVQTMHLKKRIIKYEGEII